MWFTNAGRDGILHEPIGRLAYARLWAKKLLQASRTLRRIYYVELDEFEGDFMTGTLFTLSADGVVLSHEDKGEEEIPMWYTV